ncbi:MAG: disulfide bond formation protein DsbA [Burkholderiales bacterium 35-55-47]|jgi:thiol:disulfide interchange protein DsbA|uniref:thiol:disulfide interchange protein DsbA/DsbL n=1 Tax=Limnohabitans sp. TaxID=1907725 RepID=UPI000BCB552F|nr:thiol:disulfide interchange protein DsbA/DsbL [Limnohabitans sp.]OYY18498.1 MAG: disulfide bond formation protein DsbA [Burkholderiales bacterium 35-55-47]OYZ72909.1 MAG: disulfide bond formation protein DsbA [Burkholderiales bacterium 24-55-52]OZA99420.1 MAG: disulfide bond formation protein DsbA [Burkholderiales bacterium 39-55-53]HQR87335.1 thiol:disulfide interchange protein DsbA/DsbL [Limnohabitans sp.]HQS27617.1 thiol:disulfide interchange protein DsbA/DsbL [Limnohabitans sp.]
MKRRDFSLAAAATVAGLPLAAQAQGPAAAKPVEGKDYLSLDKRVPTDVGTGKIEVLEFFWYSCPHCHSFEPQFAAWVKAAPKDVVVQRVPVRFRDDFEAQQRAYYVFESLNMVDAMHGKLFHAIHTERQQLNNAQALAAWANKNGLPEKKFMDTFNSFGVATKSRRATQLQDAFKVQGVPALGIAGRFYTDGGLAQTMDRALQVADYLIGEVRRGR